MGNKLYVGNLPYKTTEPVVRELFCGSGTVLEVILIRNPVTKRSRGFAFVTMASKEEASAAILANHGKEFEGRRLIVNEAKPHKVEH